MRVEKLMTKEKVRRERCIRTNRDGLCSDLIE